MKVLVLLTMMLFGTYSHGAEYNAPEGYREGEIHSLDFGNSTMVLQGQTYHVSPTARVEIAGSYGAFTMLQPGMRIAARFLRYDNGRREIFEVVEVPDNQELLVR